MRLQLDETTVDLPWAITGTTVTVKCGDPAVREQAIELLMTERGWVIVMRDDVGPIPPWIASFNRRRGFDGTGHRLIGVEFHPTAGDGGNWSICECGWTSEQFKVGTHVASALQARIAHGKHVFERAAEVAGLETQT